MRERQRHRERERERERERRERERETDRQTDRQREREIEREREREMRERESSGLVSNNFKNVTNSFSFQFLKKIHLPGTGTVRIQKLSLLMSSSCTGTVYSTVSYIIYTVYIPYE